MAAERHPCDSRCRRDSRNCASSCAPTNWRCTDWTAADVLKTINAAFHGTVVAELNQSDRSVPIVVRVAGVDGTPQAVRDLVLRGRQGAWCRCRRWRRWTWFPQRSLVNHEDGLRRQVVVANPKTTDQAGYARAARQAVAAKVKLPADVYLRYGGTAPAQAAARA